MYNLYQKFIHFNEYENTWNVFDRTEANTYLNERENMSTLSSFTTIQELLDAHKTDLDLSAELEPADEADDSA